MSIVTFESLTRQRARRLGYQVVRIWESGAPRGDYTLQTFGGYVVISPVSMEEIDSFLSEKEASR